MRLRTAGHAIVWSRTPRHAARVFHFESERIQERVVTPTSFRDSLQGAEKVYSVDAGSTVTWLYHGQAAESYKVGVVEIPDLFFYKIPAL